MPWRAAGCCVGASCCSIARTSSGSFANGKPAPILSAQVRDLCINLLRDVMSRARRAAAPAGLHPAGAAADLRRPEPPSSAGGAGNWPPRFGDCTAPCRSWNRPRWPAQLAKELLNHPAGKPFAAAAQRLRTVGHVIPAYVDHQRFPFHLRQRFQARSNNRLVGYARIVDHQQGQVAKMPGPNGPSCLPVCCGS